jgi:aspartate aminotransferase
LEVVAAEARKRGVRIIPLNIGAPDTSSPPEMLESVTTYLATNNHVEYGPSAGDGELRESRSRFYKNNLDLPIDPDEILVTAGASEAMEMAVYSVTNPGDEILSPEPFFSNYLSTCYKYGTSLKTIPTRIEDGFHLIQEGESSKVAFDRITSYISPQTKAIFWSSPSNPTGAIYKTEELELLYQVAKTHNLFLISDEVYRLLVFDEGIKTKKGFFRAPSIYDVVPESERWRILGLDSSSKEVSFCGGRIGYLTLDKSFIPIVLKNASIRACPSVLGQKAVERIDKITNAYFSNNRRELKIRRDLVYDRLSGMQDIGIRISPRPPEGAFYIPFDLERSLSAERFCRWMLTDFPQMTENNTTVFLTPMRSGNGGFLWVIRQKVKME